MFQDGPHVTTQRPSRLLRVDLRWPSPSRSPMALHRRPSRPLPRERAHSAEHRRRPKTPASPTRLCESPQAIRPDNEAPTCRCRTKGSVLLTAVTDCDTAHSRRPCRRQCAANSRLFVRRHASHVRLIPYWQLHGLFDSLFRVLFNFPSLYLLTIGLVVIFSFRWSLPPA